MYDFTQMFICLNVQIFVVNFFWFFYKSLRGFEIASTAEARWRNFRQKPISCFRFMKLQKSSLSVVFVKVFALDRKRLTCYLLPGKKIFRAHFKNLQKIWQNFFSTSSSCHYPIPVRKVQQINFDKKTRLCSLQCAHCNVFIAMYTITMCKL